MTLWASLVAHVTWRRKWQPTPVFLPGEFHGQRAKTSYSPWSCKESDTIEQLTLSLASQELGNLILLRLSCRLREDSSQGLTLPEQALHPDLCQPLICMCNGLFCKWQMPVKWQSLL